MERELKKVDDNNYLLVTNDDKAGLKTEKKFEKTELKEIYGTLKLQLEQLKMARAQNKKEIDKLGVTETPQLKEFAEKMDVAQKLLQVNKLVEKEEGMKKDLVNFKNQLKEISTQIPELLRNK